jgi:hypothetical protein
LKQNHIPALIVSTPGFGLAPCRGRCGIGFRSSRRLPQPCPRQWPGRCISERWRGGRQDPLECEPVIGREPYLPLYAPGNETVETVETGETLFYIASRIRILRCEQKRAISLFSKKCYFSAQFHKMEMESAVATLIWK